MPTPRTRNTDSTTRVRRKKQLTLPAEVCVQMGIEVGETFKVSRVKRSQKVAKGTIVLIPEPVQPWTDEEWVQKEREADEDIRLGRVSGPYTDAKQLIAHLRRDAKKWQKKSKL